MLCAHVCSWRLLDASIPLGLNLLLVGDTLPHTYCLYSRVFLCCFLMEGARTLGVYRGKAKGRQIWLITQGKGEEELSRSL